MNVHHYVVCVVCVALYVIYTHSTEGTVYITESLYGAMALSKLDVALLSLIRGSCIPELWSI